VQVHIADLLAMLPEHMQALLFDVAPRPCPPAPSPPAATPQDFSDLPILCPTFDDHLLQCSELCNIFTTVLHTGPEHRSHIIATYNWPGIQAAALGLQTGVAAPSPLLTGMIAVADALLSKVLAVGRSDFCKSMLAPNPSSLQQCAIADPLLKGWCSGMPC
jgi:hypothetical protein